MMRFENIITLPSGNLARGFNVRDLGNGRVRIQYVYTDRRCAHQVSRRYTVEFLNGKVDSIVARSARGGRVEFFKTSTIINELRSMLAEFLEASQAVAQRRYAKVEAPVEQDTVSEDDTDLKNTVELLRGVVMINMIITLVTLGIVWFNL